MPWGAAELAARHAVTDLVNAHPHLWPLLNRLTLTSSTTDTLPNSVNWCAVLQAVQAAQRQRASHVIPIYQEIT